MAGSLSGDGENTIEYLTISNDFKGLFFGLCTGIFTFITAIAKIIILKYLKILMFNEMLLK